MGLWNFVKSAGKAIGIGGAKADEAPDPESLKKELSDLGLGADDLVVAVEGDKVIVRGSAASQEAKEKLVLALGNVAGVAEVEDEVQTPEPAVTPVLHIVVKGDTLWKISEKALGSGARYTDIFEANRPMLSDPDKIYPGQVLRIPQ